MVDRDNPMATSKDFSSETETRPPDGARWLAIDGLLGAAASASCCIVPLALFSVGATGAWIGNLTALAPYQPFFVVVTLGLLGAGYWQVYRSAEGASGDADACGTAGTRRLVKAGLWSATVLVAAAIAFPYVAPYLFLV